MYPYLCCDCVDMYIFLKHFNEKSNAQFQFLGEIAKHDEAANGGAVCAAVGCLVIWFYASAGSFSI